ncbi:MAG: hypothetical protein KDC38_09280 [Planctomycetes bacterium]|nr:hypothetical protein [Planctomycetota bacterium]
MRGTDQSAAESIVLSCPLCECEPDIWLPAETEPGVVEHVSVVDALVLGFRAAGRPYYRCECGYEELVDPEAPTV